MINEKFAKRKIALIQNELEHLMPLAGYSFDEIAKDFMKQAAMERFLERVVNRAIDLNQHIIAESVDRKMEPPLTYKKTFLILADLGIYPQDFAKSIGKSAGTRNVLVHDYDEADQEEVYASVSDCLKDYTQYCNYILKFLEKSGNLKKS